MDETKLEKMWGSVGFIMHLAQLIEYNIVNIIAGYEFLKDTNAQKKMTIGEYEKRAYRSNKKLHSLTDNKNTMGNVVKAAKDVNLFDEELTAKIDAIKERRDYYAHIFFKEQLLTKDMENDPDTLLDQLSLDIFEMNSINNQLLGIDKKQREEANNFKRHITKNT